MNIFDSFATWLEKVFNPIIDLYHEDSTTFFVGAIIVVFVLLIIIIVLARRAESDDSKPSKKVKYEDIDWSTDDGKAALPEKAPEKTAPVYAKPTGAYEAAVSKAYGVGDVDVDKNTFGHEGLPPEITEALMKSIRPGADDLSVPKWMTKQTLSLDDIELSDAQEWVEQQLREKETRAHDRKVERATVERIAEILEKIDLCDKAKEEYKKNHGEEKASEAPVKSDIIDLDSIAPLGSEPEVVPEPVREQETVPEPENEPETVPEENISFETGTLEKILKEAEEINAGQSDDDEEPDWGIAATLARLEAMQAENDSLLREIEADAALPEDYSDMKPEPDLSAYESGMMPADVPEPESSIQLPGTEDVPAENEAAYRHEPQIRLSRRGAVMRFGVNNRDTNRSGRKFTEEELMKQIRD